MPETHKNELRQLESTPPDHRAISDGTAARGRRDFAEHSAEDLNSIYCCAVSLLQRLVHPLDKTVLCIEDVLSHYLLGLIRLIFFNGLKKPSCDLYSKRQSGPAQKSCGIRKPLC